MNTTSKNVTTTVARGALGTVFGGSLLMTAGLAVAGAEPLPTTDGMVNVVVGETTILSDVPTTVASTTTAALCGTSVGDVTSLVERVDTQGVDQIACTGLPGGDLVLAQNTSAETPMSPVVPETRAGFTAEDSEGAVEGDSEHSIEGDLGGAGAAEPPTTEGSDDNAG